MSLSLKETILSKGILKVDGIRCENPSCDYENTSIQPQEYKKWVDQPCPKCGTVLLTENDYNLAKLLFATTTIANKIPDEEEASLPTEVGKVYSPLKKTND